MDCHCGGLNIYNVKSGKVKGLVWRSCRITEVLLQEWQKIIVEIWVTSARHDSSECNVKGDTGEYQFVPCI